MPQQAKVLIIGVDGFTWRLGRGFMAAGVMPRLANLVKQGCHGKLRSVMPFETSPAWSSFQTGCLPGKTGVFGFHRYDRKLKKVRLNNFADIAVPTLWELAARAGKRIVSLNMPLTWPAPKVDGVIIPGLLCPNLSAETVYPAEAYNRYIKPHKDYLIVNNDWRDTVSEFTQQSVETERVRCRVALELIKDIDWDIFCVQMQSTDLMQHRLWWALDTEARGYSGKEREEALEFYRFCDEVIGKIVEAAGTGVLTLLISDHGFCGLEHSVSVNVWLRKQGYLQLLPAEPKSKWTAAKDHLKERSPAVLSLTRLYGRILTRPLRRILENLRRSGSTPVFFEKELVHIRRIVDFEKTKAFCLGAMGGMLYINGTGPQRAELARKLVGELLRDLGPESQNPTIDRIASGAETYGRTQLIDALPDLVLQYKQGVGSITNPVGEAVVRVEDFDGRQPGTHSRDGILVANGPGIQSAATLHADIVDIVPTALAYLGIPVPRHMDGKVLDKAFIEPLKAHYENVAFGGAQPIQYSDAEQAEVEKRLTGLGYL